MKTISFPQSLKLENPLYIDLRTPAEFEKGTIPGAINIPIFTDQEREKLGWEYKNLSPQAAKVSGLRLVAPKLPDLIEKIDRVRAKQPVVLFCWRGGLRSQAIQQVSHLLDIETYRLKGGYREFRRYVLEFLKEFEPPGPLVTIHGLTGAGKTRILKKLSQENFPVIDLESLAGHRGSVFGKLGIKGKVGQKKFDALLWRELDQLGDFPFLIVEGESKRIGSIYLPDFLLGENRKRGVNIFLVTPLEKRTEYIWEEYSQGMNEEDLLCKARNCLMNIETKVREKAGKAVVYNLEQALAKEDLFSFIFLLLRDYYDPLYSGYLKQFDKFDFQVSGEDIIPAAEKISGFLKNRFSLE